jgi:hypothetical protein
MKTLHSIKYILFAAVLVVEALAAAYFMRPIH